MREEAQPLVKSSVVERLGMSGWRFSVAGDGCRAAVRTVPTEETKETFWQRAVPRLALFDCSFLPKPCVVVCRVSAPAGFGDAPGGPAGCAKALLDALHDDRSSGPWYRDLTPDRPPLAGGHAGEVRGLAVEVQTGDLHTEYLLGADLVVRGELLASVPLDLPATDDSSDAPDDAANVDAARAALASALQQAHETASGLTEDAAALVVRHTPQHDESTAWARWIAAACGAGGQGAASRGHAAGSAGWRPMSVASIADPGLAAHAVYEIWR